MHMTTTIDHTSKDSLFSKPTVFAATCASNTGDQTEDSALRRFSAKAKLWFSANRTVYSERERQRYVADSAVQRAHYRMRSFY